MGRLGRISWKNFMRGFFAVNCKTVEEALFLLGECDDKNIRWLCGAPALAMTMFEVWDTDTCYYIIDGRICADTKNKIQNKIITLKEFLDGR